MGPALGDDAVIAAYRRFFPILASKCARMLEDPDEARDVAQETFTRLWSERLALRDATAVTAWLYRTSTRLAVDRYRDPWRRARQVVDWDELRSGAEDPEARTHWRRLLAQLGRRVPADELEVAILARL